MSQSDFLINNLICPTLLETSKGQLGGSCWRSLTTISRCQLDQKIMRVCISCTHLYSIKFLNHTLPSRICKMCFWANMQVTSTLWSDRKSQKISEHRFRLKWTKVAQEPKQNKSRQANSSVDQTRRPKQAQPPAFGGGWRPGQAGRADQARGVLRPVAPSYKYKGGGRE